jgi:hyaluronan synthase
MIRNRSHVRSLNRRLRTTHSDAAGAPAAPADHTAARAAHRSAPRASAPAAPPRVTPGRRPARVAPPVHVELPVGFDLSIFDVELLDLPAPFDGDDAVELEGPAPEPAPAAATDAPSAEPETAPPADPVAVARPVIDRPTRYGSLLDPVLRLVAFTYLAAIVTGVVVYKAAFIQMLTIDPFFAAYGLLVSGYIVSRFVISLFYRPGKPAGLEPHVAIVVPAFNEEAAIAQSLQSLLALDYPAHKLQIVAIDDGSSDGTLRELNTVAARADGRVHVIAFPENRGKRAAMAAGIRATDAEIVAFVDSDSVLEADAMRVLVQGFANDRVGAICGHADVLNVRATWLTRMQAVRYFVAFKVIKAAESVFDAVTCCSGCFSAYRREAILPHLDWWENQTFLGIESTFGDDRSLTNCVLRDWKVRYEERAVSHTIVPETFRQFMKQQTRWKRSWTRESLIVAKFIWRKNPIAALATYISVVLPLLAPIAALRAIVWQPVMHGTGAPVVYILGIYAIALVYGLYFALRQRRYDTLWLSGILFVFFYLAFLLWQTYYAILTSRTRSWGTRAAQPAEATS